MILRTVATYEMRSSASSAKGTCKSMFGELAINLHGVMIQTSVHLSPWSGKTLPTSGAMILTMTQKEKEKP